MALCFRNRAVLAAIFLLLPSVWGTANAQDARRDVQPNSRPQIAVQTAFTKFGSTATNETSKRTFVSYPDNNTVVGYDFDGTVVASNTTLARPTDLLLYQGALYALLAASGQLVRLDQSTLSPTIVSSGLDSPSGLVVTNSLFYTVSLKLYQGGTKHRFVSIDPATGVQVVAPFLEGNQPPSEQVWMFTSANHPGVIFWQTAFATTPSGVNRRTLVTGTDFHLHEDMGDAGFLPDGDLLVEGSNSVGVALDPVTLKMTGRSWRDLSFQVLSEVQDIYALAVGAKSVAVLSKPLIRSFTPNVLITDMRRPGEVFRSFQLLDGETETDHGMVLVDNDQRLIGITYFQGQVRLNFLPGIGGAPAPQAPGLPTSARTAAPQASGNASPPTRQPAPQVISPARPMKSVGEVEFDRATGEAWVSDPLGNQVNVFSPSGQPLIGIGSMRSVGTLEMHQGVMHAVIEGEGAIARFDRASGSVTRSCGQLSRPTGLVSAKGNLWTTALQNDGSQTLRNVSAPTCGPVIALMGQRLATAAIDIDLFLGDPFGVVRRDGATGSIVAQANLSPTEVYAPVAVRGEKKFFTSGGFRVDSTSLQLDGVRYGARTEAGYEASDGPNLYVTAREQRCDAVQSDFFTFIDVFGYATGGEAIRSARISRTYDVLAHRFAPNSTVVWLAVRDVNTGEILIGPAFDAATGTGFRS